MFTDKNHSQLKFLLHWKTRKAIPVEKKEQKWTNKATIPHTQTPKDANFLQYTTIVCRKMMWEFFSSKNEDKRKDVSVSRFYVLCLKLDPFVCLLVPLSHPVGTKCQNPSLLAFANCNCKSKIKKNEAGFASFYFKYYFPFYYYYRILFPILWWHLS